jgi:hypothetical protein
VADYSARALASEWQVRDIPIATARALVEANHYAAGASNTATYLHGLYGVLDGQPYGCAWWIRSDNMLLTKMNPIRQKGRRS